MQALAQYTDRRRLFDIWNQLLTCLMLSGLILSGCANQSGEKTGKIFGDLNIPFSSATKSTTSDDTTFPVNTYLWNASYSIMKRASFSIIDPQQGLLQTEWLTIPPYHKHRFRFLARIQGNNLTSAALDINLVHQQRDDGQWQTRQPDKNDLELKQLLRFSILDRARTLFISSRYSE